jgi:hypothetical protein
LIAFLALAGVISIETAIFAACFGGGIVAGLIWTFIQHRKSILLNIRKPEVRDLAHRAMLEYLSRVDPDFAPYAGVFDLYQDHQDECGRWGLS